MRNRFLVENSENFLLRQKTDHLKFSFGGYASRLKLMSIVLVAAMKGAVVTVSSIL